MLSPGSRGFVIFLFHLHKSDNQRREMAEMDTRMGRWGIDKEEP